MISRQHLGARITQQLISRQHLGARITQQVIGRQHLGTREQKKESVLEPQGHLQNGNLAARRDAELPAGSALVLEGRQISPKTWVSADGG